MATIQKQRGVRTLHPDYERMAPQWRKCRDVIAGQSAMHKAGTMYLPRLKDETDEDYKARLARSDFFNGSWITLRAFVGMLFRKPPRKEVPAALDEYLADVTLTGKEVETFAKGLAHEALAITRYGILVDHPSAPENVVPLTVAAAREMMLRPKLALYTAEAITNWRPQEAGKPGQYAMVTLAEEHPIPEDEFSHKCEKRWRVLDLGGAGGTYRQRVFRLNDKEEDELVGEPIVPLMNGQPLREIPFRTYGADGEEAEVDEPALIDLVDKNVAHYQVNSDYRHGLHTTALPTLFIAGLTLEPGDKIFIGGSAAIVSPDPGAKGEFIEYQGKGLESHVSALDRIERQMAMAGARAIMDESNQVETLGGTQIKRNGENSALSNVAITVSQSLEWALGVFAEWIGQKAKVVYQLNRLFLPAMMDAQTLGSLIAANQAGKLSNEELFDLMQRGDVIDSEITFEEHQEKVESQPSPARPAPRPAPGDPGVAAA